MFSHVGGCYAFRRRCPLVTKAKLLSLPPSSPLLCSTVFYASTSGLPGAPQRYHGRAGAASRSRRTFSADAQPARRTQKPHRLLQRTSLLDQLQSTQETTTTHTNSSSINNVMRQSEGRAVHSDALVTASHHLHAASENIATSYITSSQLLSGAQQAEVNAANPTTQRHPHPPPASAVASQQLQDQQRALRDAFTHARRHHNVRLKKDPRVYATECKAFRQSHQGRFPTPQEVSRTVAVPLAPVSALKTLAHTDRRRSLLHSAAADAVLLHNAVVKNELVKSSAPQLVRCLRCFHVYTARPRTLWGGEVEQSGIEYEKMQSLLADDRRLQRRPWMRKRVASVGRRQRAQQEDPTCCPQCGSPRAQWMMEYVHHHTHEKPR